jgi:hypothetical protein
VDERDEILWEAGWGLRLFAFAVLVVICGALIVGALSGNAPGWVSVYEVGVTVAFGALMAALLAVHQRLVVRGRRIVRVTHLLGVPWRVTELTYGEGWVVLIYVHEGSDGDKDYRVVLESPRGERMFLTAFAPDTREQLREAQALAERVGEVTGLSVREQV